MREAFYQLWTEFLQAIWLGFLYGVTISIGVLVCFNMLRGIAVFQKAAKMLCAE